MNTQQALNQVEEAIIAKMASVAGVQPFQMVSMIKRCDELKAYYKQVRAQVITEMAA